MASKPREIKSDRVARRRVGTTPTVETAGRNRRNNTTRISSNDRRARQLKTRAAPPPVMARNYDLEVPFQAPRLYNKKARRRFDIALNTPGAEMRLPSLPVVRLTARWLSLLLVCGLLGVLYLLWSAPFFRVESAQIEGLGRISASDVNIAMGISGEPVFALRPAQLEQELGEIFPEFSSIAVQVTLPNSVLVNVSERVPVLTWRQGQIMHLVDADGYSFPLRLSGSTVITPVIEADGNPPGLDLAPLTSTLGLDESLQGFEAAAKQEPAESGATSPGAQAYDRPLLSPSMVSAILAMAKVAPADRPLLYSSIHGLGWQDERGWQVYLGDDDEIDTKLKVYEAIVLELIDEEIQPALISVEFPHNPYFRLEK